MYKIFAAVLTTSLFVCVSNASQRPLCDSSLVPHASNFSMSEIYNANTDAFEVRIGENSRFVAENLQAGPGQVTNYYDEQTGAYWAVAFYRWLDQAGAADYDVHFFCNTNESTTEKTDMRRGFFSTMKAKIDETYHEAFDYSIIHNNLLAFVFGRENLDDSFIVRDRQMNVVASARRSNAIWQVDNPTLLPPELLAFVLTHKLNAQKMAKPLSSDGPGFWQSVVISVGLTTAFVGTILIAAQCVIAMQQYSSAQLQPRQPVEPQMFDDL